MSDIPVACTLGAEAMPERLARWRGVLQGVARRVTLPDGARRLEFGPAGTELAELAGLMAAEVACCAFFSFTLHVDGAGVALEVRAPDEGRPMVAELFG